MWPHGQQPTRLPGILQARILEWVAISFFNARKWKMKVKLLSRVWLLAALWTAAYQAPPSLEFSRQEYWHGLPLPYPKLQWVAISYSRVSSWPRDRTCISCIGRWILYHWTTWETPRILYVPPVHHFLNPQPLAATDPFSFHSFPFSRMSYSGNHTVFSPFRLASFT